VGSSYVHFNYSPHQDKATPSLLGDVPGGVLLNKPPIFLGGQGGLVGPARITYGVIAPAGMIIRKDILRPGLAGEVLPPGSPPGAGNAGQSAAGQNQFVTGAYRAVDRIIRNNLVYIGNIYALQAWYHHVRSKFMVRDPFQSACFDGALEQLESMAGERIKRLDELAGKMPLSIELNKQTGTADASCLQPQKHFADSWQRMKEEILRLVQFEGETSKRDVLLSEISAGHGRHQYLKAITLLSPEGKSCASLWLQSIVDRVSGIWKTV
jgi:UDP-N-acetylglucosamine/UDP-N-acetylgalactosamine diphosphorylase